MAIDAEARLAEHAREVCFGAFLEAVLVEIETPDFLLPDGAPIRRRCELAVEQRFTEAPSADFDGPFEAAAIAARSLNNERHSRFVGMELANLVSERRPLAE